jgi:predicted nuclease of predicted toxin-antitoxin system
MKIVLDENVSLSLATVLREDGHDVLAVAESAEKGSEDEEVWRVACEEPSLLITRDYHFTNGVRFEPSQCLGVVFIRRGNLTASDEVALVRSFLASHPPDQYRGKLVSLSPGGVRLR